jgi:outer membrane protein assembly complex protein YaeT
MIKSLTLLIPCLIALSQSLNAENLPRREKTSAELQVSHYELGRSKVMSPSLPPDLERSLRALLENQDGMTPLLAEEILVLFSTHPDFDGAEIYEADSVYYIEPLQYPRLMSVKFNGLRVLSESEVLRILNLRVNEQILDEELKAGATRLEEIYKSLGYYQFSIQTQKNIVGKDMFYNITMREGSQIRLGEVNFISKNLALNQLLIRKMKSYKNKKFNDSMLEDFIKEVRSILIRERYYQAEISQPNIEFENEKSLLNLSLSIDDPYQYRLIFNGNKDFNQFMLLEALDFENFNSSQDAMASELNLRLRNFYLSRGYPRVETSYTEETLDETTKRMTFVIEENFRVRIDRIDFRGRFSEASKTYERFLLNHSSDLIRDRAFFKEDFEQGLKNLVLDRQNQGFLQAKVNSWRIQYSEDKRKMSLIVNFDEGALTRIEKINWLGANKISPDELAEYIYLRRGESLKLADIEKSLESLKNLYRTRGFIEMRIENEKSDLILYNEDGTKAQVQIRIYEGPRVVVSSIAVEGNSFTKESVIRNELDFREGDTLTPSKIDDSISRLQRTGFFASIDIRTLEERTSLEQRTVLVRVTERDPGTFTVGLGATNDRALTLRGYTGVGYRNLFGTGRGVSLRLEGNYNVAEIKYLENKITVSYLEPYLLETRVKGRVSATRSRTVSDPDQRLATELNQYTYSLEREFGRHVLGIYDLWNFSTLRDFDIDEQKPGFLQEIGTTGPALEVDYRDNIFNPTSGFFSRWNYEYSSPDLRSTRTISYQKTNWALTHYNKVAEGPWVWANQVRLGFLENLSSADDGGIPYDKVGYILGGRSTVRGFVPGGNDYFPRLNRGNLPADKFFLRTRAKMFLLKSELRLPLHGSLGLAIFYDGGSVHIDGLDFTDSYRDAVGLGLRYNTPFGAVSAEYGWKLDRQVTEPEGAFYLAIGSF